MNKKNNLAFRNNEENIHNSFFRLLETTDIDSVTVTGICKCAGINRSTFYTHYNDIPSLIHKLDLKIHSELMERFDTHEDVVRAFSDGSFYNLYLRHIIKYKNFYRASFSKRKDFDINYDGESITKYIAEPILNNLGITDPKYISYVITFNMAGITYIIKKWLDNDCRDSVDFVADCIKKCMSAQFVPTKL